MLLLYGQHNNYFERETYIDSLCLDVYRNALAQFRMGVSQINGHRYRFAQRADNVLCPFGCSKPENEIHFVFECPKYMLLRFRYLPESLNVNDHQK